MNFAKNAVRYYVTVTGNSWAKFFMDLDEAITGDLDKQTGDLWLIHTLVNSMISHGIKIDELKANKDVVKAEFDDQDRRKNGEFFTPIVWAEEAHRYLDKYIPNWRTEYNVWEPSCYTLNTRVYIRRRYSSRKDWSGVGNTGFVNHLLKGTWDITENDSGVVFIGDIRADWLKPGDEILTYNTETGVYEWSGYHDLFIRSYSGSLIEVFFKWDNKHGGSFFVTPDHRMLVKVPEQGFTYICAGDLAKQNQILSVVDKDDRVYEIEKTIVHPASTEVWDLTTDNNNHNFCVAVDHKSHRIMCSNCGSGNLIKTSGVVPSHLYASTLQEEDIVMIKKMPELKDCHAFQLDFLCAVDDGLNNMFLEMLPDDLQDIILNDKPLIILANPPYKSGMAKATEVGRYMQTTKSLPDFNFTDFSKSAYDIFYHFCFQIMNMVNRYNLKNTYFGFFGPLNMFVSTNANILLNHFEHCFEFVDGMCISAQEFTDTSDSVTWGLGFSVWKATGSYKDGDNFHKDVLLDKKFISPEGKIECEGKVLYEPPRQKLSKWVLPEYSDIEGRVSAPLMTSHLTFKGSSMYEKVAPCSALIAKRALGTLMIRNTLARGAGQRAILSMPTTIEYTEIMEDNFWRCVASYAFRSVATAGWAVTKKEVSAPNPNIEGYDIWLKNAIVLFLFDYKSMMSSMRNVVWEGSNNYCIMNRLFYLSEEEIREHCHDEVILRDLEEHPLQNKFMLKAIEESRGSWSPECSQLFDWCKTYTLATYDYRKTVNYRGSLDCADAGFQQLRSGLWDENKLDKDLMKLLAQCRSYLAKDIEKFGFLTEVLDK